MQVLIPEIFGNVGGFLTLTVKFVLGPVLFLLVTEKSKTPNCKMGVDYKCTTSWYQQNYFSCSDYLNFVVWSQELWQVIGWTPIQLVNWAAVTSELFMVL